MANLGHDSLQKALYLKLSGDSVLMALAAGIYDRVSQDAVFPYVVIAHLTGKDWSTKTTRGMEFSVEIEIWSREGGKKQAATIMERILFLLHDSTLSIDNNSLILSHLEESRIEPQSDGWTYKGEMRFRVLMQNS